MVLGGGWVVPRASIGPRPALGTKLDLEWMGMREEGQGKGLRRGNNGEGEGVTLQLEKEPLYLTLDIWELRGDIAHLNYSEPWRPT